MARRRKRKASLESLSFLEVDFDKDGSVAHSDIASNTNFGKKPFNIAESSDVIEKPKKCNFQSSFSEVNTMDSDINSNQPSRFVDASKSACIDSSCLVTSDASDLLRSGKLASAGDNCKAFHGNSIVSSCIAGNTIDGARTLDDSAFDNVDLSLLEQKCFAATPNKATLTLCKELNENTNFSQVQCDKKSVTAHEPDVHDSNSCIGSVTKSKPKAMSTPDQRKLNTVTPGVSGKIRQRLMQNAHKSPSTPLNVRFKKQDQSALLDRFSFLNEDLFDDDFSTQDLGPFYGLPSKVQSLLDSVRGISKLYDWQHNCLTLDSIKQGRNLIYSLPTSGGKTLVAEILIFKTLLCQKKDAVLVLPFVAIVQEKIQNLSQFAINLGFLLEEYAGSKGRFPPRKRRKKKSLYICTIEKADSLVNSLIECGRLEDLGLVVVDEFHMIGEGGRRGATVEMMLTKLMHMSSSTQVIAMSATLNNIEDLAKFLQAEIYFNDFRPVDLDEYVKYMDYVYRIDPAKRHEEDVMVLERTLAHRTKELATRDTDHLVTMVLEVIPKHSCLIFCPTKKNCENVATMICKLLPKDLLEHKTKEKITILHAFYNDGGAICPVLRKTVPYGVAYHHSGLTTDERRLVEDAYRIGVLSVITCTSTLAAGVNLPARRVIIRSPHIGRTFLSHSQYKQMIGRAGRAGIDKKGESYLIISKATDKPLVSDLVAGPFETCLSSLMYDGGKGFKSLLLTLICLKVIRDAPDAKRFFAATLFAKQIKTIQKLCPNQFKGLSHEVEIKTADDILQASLSYLLDLKLVQYVSGDKENGKLLKPTKLGIATFKGSVDLEFSNMIYTDLNLGLKNLVLDSYIHLLYLVTPYETAKQVNPNWLIYMGEFNGLTPSQITAAEVIGVPEPYIACRAAGSKPRKKKVNDFVVQRFYVTLMLHQLFKGKSVWDVSARFEQPRGFLQNLMNSSAAFASCLLHFTKEFEEFWPYHALLEKLIQVLQYCTASELVPLMEVPGVKLARAKQLYNAGYKTLSELAVADVTALVRNIEHLSRKQANQLVASAKILLTEKIETLQEEADELKTAIT
ncbi:helicase POLQ-like isoform X2 [Clavelina lepadiformis]|uniref:helicase POLQ-like isoform X2 n=1 Tax=Clavelina lepadiformis TaxID=159417 RepID=UPI0040438706